jgi:uncharacterized protein YjiS (DUF1127 family)
MDNSTTFSRQAGIVSSIPDGLAALARLGARSIARARRRRQLRRDIEILSALDDKVLVDIGFSRDQIDHAISHGRLPERSFE